MSEIVLSPIEYDKDGILVKLNYDSVKNLGITPKSKVNEVFVMPTGSTVQIAVGKPLTEIPLLTSKDKFTKQD